MTLSFGYGIRSLRNSIPQLILIDVMISEMGFGLTLLNCFVFLHWHAPQK